RDVAVVSKRVAERLFGGPAAVGRGVELFRRPYEVIGVAPDAAYSGLREQGGDQFVFVSRMPGEDVRGVQWFNIRYTGPAAAAAEAVRGLVREASETSRVVGSVQTVDAF